MKNYKKALIHFQTSDPILYKAAQAFDPKEMFDHSPTDNYFERLCRNIAGQQLSVKASQTIWGRFLDLLPNEKFEPQNILAIEHDSMRSAGLSNAKANYIRGIAEAVLNKEIDLDNLDNLTDDLVIKEMTKLKGIGVWTAEMFLMFTLGREDLFSTGDLGLKRAIEKLYQIDDPSADEMISLAQKWSQYRTYACRILWESLDNSPNT